MLLKFMTTLVLALLLAGCFTAPGYEGGASKNFNGSEFRNTNEIKQSPFDMVKLAWGAVFESAPWPARVPVDQQSVPAPVEDSIVVTYINHATTLIQVDGLTILTDPVYSERASPLTFAGPKRIHEPGIKLEDLPPIDVVLVSHNHYDHLDVATLQQLFERQQSPPVLLSGLGNSGLFKQIGLSNYRDMGWDDSAMVEGVEFVFVECQHRSGRGLGDQMKTLWGSFVIKTSVGNIYFAGDTAYSPHFAKQGEDYGPFALSILPIGAYEPRWFMSYVHVNPAEAVQAHIDLKSQQSLSIHFGTFQLTYERVDQPVSDLGAALKAKGIDPERFWTLAPGDSRLVTPVSPPRPVRLATSLARK